MADALAQELDEIAVQLDALASRTKQLSKQADPTTVDSDDVAPGVRLMRARSRAKMTQAGLSKVSGVAVNTIINFENGRTNPRPKTLMALAEAVGIPWEVLDG
jgi:DNA-binding XRE family transcriptional regulator